MARLFKLSGLNPLKCHKDDCVPNVLAYINLIEREDAFKFADVTDTIITDHILNFLTHTYGVKHGFIRNL